MVGTATAVSAGFALGAGTGGLRHRRWCPCWISNGRTAVPALIGGLATAAVGSAQMIDGFMAEADDTPTARSLQDASNMVKRVSAPGYVVGEVAQIVVQTLRLLVMLRRL